MNARRFLTVACLTMASALLPAMKVRTADGGAIQTENAADADLNGNFNSKYVFDRTYEREMKPGEKRFLDLDTGNFVETHPPGDLFWSLTESDLRVRAGLEMVAIGVKPSRWDARPDEVLRAVSAGEPEKEVRLGGEESRRTWFFRTREGRAGVVQILPHSRRPGSILVRHKLVRTRPAFAPVETRILRLDRGKRFLNLDSGELSAEMPTNSLASYLERDNGGRWFLIIEPFHNYHTERERGRTLWQSMTAEQIAEPAGLGAIPQERKGFYELRPEHLPITILIPQWGLLQVTGIDLSDGDHPSVIIQCKRVSEMPG